MNWKSEARRQVTEAIPETDSGVRRGLTRGNYLGNLGKTSRMNGDWEFI